MSLADPQSMRNSEPNEPRRSEQTTNGRRKEGECTASRTRMTEQSNGRGEEEGREEKGKAALAGREMGGMS